MTASSLIRPMIVKDAMHRGVVTCQGETSALTVARTMAAHRIHSVVVVERAVGVLSILDTADALSNGDRP